MLQPNFATFMTAGLSDDRAGRIVHQIFAQSRLAMVATDPRQPDGPIVAVNRAFTTMTGYSVEESLGRNCRFLQGADTDRGTVATIRRCISREEHGDFEILNYRKDGTTFWNALHLGPIYDECGRLILYFGSQLDATARVEDRLRTELILREIDHRVKNMFTLLPAIVSLSARGAPDAATLAADVRQRIAALARAHSLTLAAHTTQAGVSLRDLIVAVLEPYVDGGSRQRLEGPPVRLDESEANAASLTIHELAVNAVKHGALSVGEGGVDIRWEVLPGGDATGSDLLRLTWTEHSGPAVPAAPDRRGFGSELTDRLVAALGGKLVRRWEPQGLHVTLTLPFDPKASPRDFSTQHDRGWSPERGGPGS